MQQIQSVAVFRKGDRAIFVQPANFALEMSPAGGQPAGRTLRIEAGSAVRITGNPASNDSEVDFMVAGSPLPFRIHRSNLRLPASNEQAPMATLPPAPCG